MPRRYFNRELSWLEFNARVLEEAMDDRRPLLERVKFLSIFHNIRDEFFMIRVSGLREQMQSGLEEPSEDGLTPSEQLTLIRQRVLALERKAHHYFEQGLRCRLAEAGIYLQDYQDLSRRQRAALKTYFDRNVYPVLTPLAVDPGHPFPHISNLSLSLAVILRDPDGVERFARVKIPQQVLPRFVPVEPEGERSRQQVFVWLEQLVAAHLGSLFHGMEIVQSFPFRVLRDADLEIREDEADDLLRTIEQSLIRRRFGSVVRLTVARDTPQHVRGLLMKNLEIDPVDLYEEEGPLGLSDLMALYDLDLPALKDPPFRPHVPASLRGSDIFAAIRARDILLHLPYDSFAPVVEFVRAAAADPDVLAIKQTIYRVGRNSPIIEALGQASVNGKQVSAVLELKARFDEENNIEWARALERVGVHVVYGEASLKTHCKALLVVRKEADGIRRYVHLSTGNYNVRTARLYTDLCLFTCDPDIGEDVSALFNSLTGYSLHNDYRKLLVSPRGIRQGMVARIEREIGHAQAGRGGHLIFKFNALTDFPMVDTLYRASQAGVKIDLIVRSNCCLVPGVEGLSENIRVISIVGRFLEHDRVYYFRNGGKGDEEVWLGSADLMERNLNRRVETLFPVEDREWKAWIIEELLAAYLKDTRNARLLLPDGTYQRVTPEPDEPLFDCQDWFLTRSHEQEARARDGEAFPATTRIGD